jgi:hypothetical protein
MLRRIANVVFLICIAWWCLLALVLCMTIISQGWNGVASKLLHLARNSRNFPIQSWSLVVWRLLALLVITTGTGYFGRPKRRETANA